MGDIVQFPKHRYPTLKQLAHKEEVNTTQRFIYYRVNELTESIMRDIPLAMRKAGIPVSEKMSAIQEKQFQLLKDTLVSIMLYYYSVPHQMQAIANNVYPDKQIKKKRAKSKTAKVKHTSTEESKDKANTVVVSNT